MLSFEEKLQLAIEFNKKIIAGQKAGKIATSSLIKNNELSEKDLEELVALYPKFMVGIDYKIGDLIQYKEILFEVIQSHTSQLDWTPDITPSLFKSKSPHGVIPNWTQPVGSHDAYKIGDKVLFDGQVYESTIDGNVWSPVDYPQGWKLV